MISSYAIFRSSEAFQLAQELIYRLYYNYNYKEIGAGQSGMKFWKLYLTETNRFHFDNINLVEYFFLSELFSLKSSYFFIQV